VSTPFSSGPSKDYEETDLNIESKHHEEIKEKRWIKQTNITDVRKLSDYPYAIRSSDKSSHNKFSHMQYTSKKPISNPKKQKAVPLQTSLMTFETELEVDNFIRNSLTECSKKNIADLLRISAKVSKLNRKSLFLKKHLPAIAFRLEDLSASTWSFRDIHSVMYGLMFVTVNDKGALNILEVMTKIIRNSLKDPTALIALKGESISLLLFGLQVSECTQHFR
jgi:hypothetical protein